LSKFQAYGMARKAKASSDVTFNVDDPPEAYSDPGIHARITTYASEVRSVRSDWDPSTDDIDGTVVMRVGQGKKHGRYWLGDGVLDSTQVPSLSQIRAETPSGGPAIRQRSSPSQQKIVALEAENKRLNEKVANHAKQLAEIKAFLQSQNGGALLSPHASPVSTYEPSWLGQVLSAVSVNRGFE